MAKVSNQKPEQTEEQKQAELQARVQGANAEILPLLKKYNLGLGAVPFIRPDGGIGAKAVFVNEADIPREKEGETESGLSKA